MYIHIIDKKPKVGIKLLLISYFLKKPKVGIKLLLISYFLPESFVLASARIIFLVSLLFVAV